MPSAHQLLSGIQSESLQKLLVSLQVYDSDAVTKALETGIPALDSSLSRLAPNYLRWGDFIHIHGPSRSGKSLLVYQLVVTCCMPLNHLSDPLRGWNKVAFVLDMDGTFDIDQLHQFLVQRLAKVVPSLSLNLVLDESLKRVHIFRLHSSEQLAATLVRLPRHHSINFPDAVMGMIVVHSLEAFHWIDQFKGEQFKSSTPHGRTTSYQRIFSELDSLRRSYGTVGVISHWGLPGIQNAIDTLQQDIHFRTFHFHLGTDSRTNAATDQSRIFHLPSDWFKMN